MAEDDRKVAEPSTREEGEIPQQERNGEPDFSKKHDLEHKWTLWFDNPKGSQKPSTWGQTLRAVYTFGTVEDFWCLYNNIKPPSWLTVGTDFHLFKEGVEPKWEDPTCEHGGKWTVLVPKSPNSKQVLDTYWLNAILACIGEQFTEGDEICGIVVNVRAKQDKLCVWTKTAANEAAQVSIGKQLKQILDLDTSATGRIGYLAHSDAKRDDRKAKDRYLV
ncbi:Eukaryotic translation initiation factor 4E-1 [Coccomyxa sp. Obi]|nr:Eukaryotic translation initiation factor 4E-1 [Coccomyxa sp. Obi]